MTAQQQIRRRHIVQWTILPVVIVTIALGWKYPILGFSVPLVMTMGLVGGIFRGRYVCGNLCPRGAFFDRMVGPVSRKSGIPLVLKNMVFRWIVVALLMGFMLFQILQNPSDWRHWGIVFWRMCVITTSLGLLLGLIFHQRAWCAFCPMGTLQNAIGGGKGLLKIDSDLCRECLACEKACPMRIPIVSHKKSGAVEDRDCIKCSECVAVCPFKALSWQNSKTDDRPHSAPQQAARQV